MLGKNINLTVCSLLQSNEREGEAQIWNWTSLLSVSLHHFHQWPSGIQCSMACLSNDWQLPIVSLAPPLRRLCPEQCSRSSRSSPQTASPQRRPLLSTLIPKAETTLPCLLVAKHVDRDGSEKKNNTHGLRKIPPLGVSTSVCSHVCMALLTQCYNYLFICLLLPGDFHT